MVDLLEFWSSPFHCMQLIINRETLNHRDTSGWTFGYDLLATFGDYNNGVLSLPTIGINCEYNPGTVTALMGKLIVHGVAPVNGERFCFAQFVRPGVFVRAFPDEAEPQPPSCHTEGTAIAAADFKWEKYGGTVNTFTFRPMSFLA